MTGHVAPISKKASEVALQTVSPNPYLFVVGCARSGTTLLLRMIEAHPQIAMTPETHWIPRYYLKRKGLTPDGLVTPKLIEKLLEYDRFRKLNIGREELERLLGSGQPVSYATFVSGIFDLYGKAKGKPLVGDKTPHYAQYIGILHALWPKVKFVHLIRDGRDACLSVLSWRGADRLCASFATGSEDRVSTAALWWKRMVRLGGEAGTSLGPELYYEMRYESLVTQPAHQCEALCAFLGVPYDEGMVRFHEGRTRTDPGLSAKHAWLPPTPGLRDWSSQMPPDDVERFEAAAGDLLDELAYPRAFPNPSADRLKHASRMRNLFSGGVRSLPQRWEGVRAGTGISSSSVSPYRSDNPMP